MELKRFNFESLECLEIHPEAAEYIVWLDGIKIEFYYKPCNESDILYVFSPGYLNRERYTHPYYQRIKWFDLIRRKGLILTDPTLNLDGSIEIVWMQGDAENYYLELQAKLVKKIMELEKVSSKRTMFYGSSAGGFASLMFLNYFKDSFAVVNNPQTDILRFYRPRRIKKLLEIGFSGICECEVNKKFLSRCSVAESFANNNHISRFIYVQNVSDFDHYQNHMIPFKERLVELSKADGFNVGDMIFSLYQCDKSKHNPAVYNNIKKYFSIAERMFL